MFRSGVSTAANAVRVSARNYATLREIEMRLKSIKNIEKITNTMKIVASTRLSKAQKAMASSRVFNETDKEFLSNAEPKPIEEEASKSDDKTLLIVVSSDKGLCGSIHSQVSKAARKRTEELNGNVDIVCIGDKVKAQILRTYADKVKLAFNGVGKEEPNFTEVALIADEIAKLGNYENVEILYNKFVSGVSFEPSKFAIYAADAIANSPGLSKYELENEEITSDVAQFSLANNLLTAMAEGYASEVSARRNAMDNASKNAGDMINSYSILYNRTRQAVITNELVDIITGASSLD
ncbi:ATP synthase F1, gamma subunit [Candida albicans SC5314]|uniref:ATP synthase subunit gamma n=1 Tax=Candida albicans P78048 TaxID=1094989 RepID=A0AB34PLH2_CANAX|nr:ATP synthase F1, gamma subunit [Candida albicans P94015]KGQ82739.1 ATP synthase F1, gamma subunit [Candida albicans P37005]KGQ83871.1 ATP synthase F1, gamma subunit [Candida albicans GC75]KGR04377.1 ATP synthase F1, gamma subunit [Candida albicans P78048]KGT64707.1 ATP synthase F1, gamma subunit [Candida albicans 12C]KGU01974.1 ATP synthase F1, gamma subunit [Candida albicans P87]KGU23733.1 ATP synthase F1, gamma subunit [Candida albicans P75063]KHC29511.1 ATP synthase F1, gamma subunit [